MYLGRQSICRGPGVAKSWSSRAGISYNRYVKGVTKRSDMKDLTSKITGVDFWFPAWSVAAASMNIDKQITSCVARSFTSSLVMASAIRPV